MTTDYGLKESYNFKEIKIKSGIKIEELHKDIIYKIAPAIIHLEENGLINGFHFIWHEKIDLRISSNNWDETEEEIKIRLEEFGLPSDFKDWSMSTERYFGDIGVLLCYNSLEFNSRIILQLLQEKFDENNDRIINLYASQLPHYHFIQFGWDNITEAIINFENSINQFDEIIERNKNVYKLLNKIQGYLTEAETKINTLQSHIKELND